MIPTAVIPILLPLNYTIRLLLLETPHRQPRKPMTIWLSPHRVSRIPTSSSPKNTVKWIVLCFSSLELKCKLYFFRSLAMVSLLVVGALTSLGGTGMQESLKYHSRLKDSAWMSLTFPNENSQLEVLLPWEWQMRGPSERAWTDTNMQYTAPRTVITLQSDEKNIPVLLLQHALFLAAKDITVAGMTIRPAPIIPGNHHSKQEMGFWFRPSSTALTIKGIALRVTPNRSRTSRLNPLQDVHPSQQVMVTPWFKEKCCQSGGR